MIDFILDSDVGADSDDVMALGYLAYMQKKGVLTVKAVSHAHVAKHGPALIRSVFRTVGLPVPEVGRMVGGVPFNDYYCEKTCEKFAIPEDYAECDTAVRVLRRALVNSTNTVVLCAIGPLTNMGALFMSEGDDISPLSGVELVKEKCDRVILMAGCFVDTDYTGEQNGARMPEFNARHDTPATQTVVAKCPVPIVFLGFETGWDMNFGKAVIEKLGDSQVLPKAFIEYPYNRDGNNYSWDPATCVYAIEGCLDFFEESEWGTVTVDDKGTTYHTPDPNGKHRFLTMKKIEGKTEQDVKDACGRYLDEIAIKLYEI